MRDGNRPARVAWFDRIRSLTRSIPSLLQLGGSVGEPYVCTCSRPVVGGSCAAYPIVCILVRFASIATSVISSAGRLAPTPFVYHATSEYVSIFPLQLRRCLAAALCAGECPLHGRHVHLLVEFIRRDVSLIAAVHFDL